ncbi:FISUMP domain-containing protein [Bacteroidota bacterium]
MKTILSILLVCFIWSSSKLAQTVTGKVVDQEGDGLSGLQVQLYVNPDVYTTTSESDGSFEFNNITSVEEGSLPLEYEVSNNYPNPFNPITRINIKTPKTSNIRIELYNITGERVRKIREQKLNSGNNYIDLELSGLPNGVYIARISIDEKYLVIRKLMLLYGSQHQSNSVGQLNNHLNKIFMDTVLDSIVVSNKIIGRKTFTNLPPLTENTLNIGDLIIERYCPENPTVTYADKTYNTVKIGEHCWLKENLDVGVMIQGNKYSWHNGTIEKYCYDNDPSNCDIYGGLYQWNEAMQYSTIKGTQGICPDGWHIPTEEVLWTLALEYQSNALKAVGQGIGMGKGTNETGFSALLAGIWYYQGPFDRLGHSAYLWSSSVISSYEAWSLWLPYDSNIIGSIPKPRDTGRSVRCIKNY